MNWEHPQWLWWTSALPFLGLLCWRLKKNSAIFFPHLGELESVTAGRLWLKRLLLVLELASLGLIILALSGPRLRHVTQQDVHEGMAIQLVVDVSSSMDINFNSGQASLSRMEAAKRVLQSFISGGDEGLGGREQDLIGLITFARYSDVVCPLTLSHSALVEITKDLQVNETPNEDGTAYGDALALASAQLKSFEQNLQDSGEVEHTAKVVVLLTDGENNCGLHMPEQAAAMAAQWGIKVYVISMGDMAERQKMTVNGEVFQTKSIMNDNAWLLKKMAEGTGGIYRHADDFDSLLSIYEQIDALEKGQLLTQSLERFSPAITPFVLSALLLLVLSVVLRFWALKGVW